jgi:hypothetical protein
MFHTSDWRTGQKTPVGDRLVVLNDQGETRFELTVENGELRVRTVHGEVRKGVYYRPALIVKPHVSNVVSIDLTRAD